MRKGPIEVACELNYMQINKDIGETLIRLQLSQKLQRQKMKCTSVSEELEDG